MIHILFAATSVVIAVGTLFLGAALLYVYHKKSDRVARPLLPAFSAFFVALAILRVIEAAAFWHTGEPSNFIWLGVMRLVVITAGGVTVFVYLKSLPLLLSYPGPHELSIREKLAKDIQDKLEAYSQSIQGMRSELKDLQKAADTLKSPGQIPKE